MSLLYLTVWYRCGIRGGESRFFAVVVISGARTKIGTPSLFLKNYKTEKNSSTDYANLKNNDVNSRFL